ncbi:MAG TPA: FlgT C-terminal domain-containing protein [Blastocatellia bacterium]|nr:FlgT C-terminal domain-containing protein [Blastocatellia bacterium]
MPDHHSFLQKHLSSLALILAVLLVTCGAGFAQDPLTVGVRYFRITSAPDADYRGDAKALASSLRIALDATKGFKQIVTLDDEQVEQITKLVADSKKGAYNKQLPGNLAEAPEAYVFPELLRVGAVERDMFARIEVTYTVEMGAAAVDPVTRAILFSDKVTISEKRNKTDLRGGAKNVYEDLVSKATDRLAAKLAAFFLKRGRILRVADDHQTVYINLGSRHNVQPGDRFTVHRSEREGSQKAGDNAEEEGLAEFDLDAKGTIEVTEVRENAAKAKLSGAAKEAITKGDTVRIVKK